MERWIKAVDVSHLLGFQDTENLRKIKQRRRGGPGSDSQQLCLKTKHARLVSRSHPDGEKCLGISDGLWFMDVYGRASATTIAVHAHESCVFVKLAPGVRCDALEAENTRIRCLVG